MTARALRLREESLLSMRSWVDRLFGWVMLVQVIGAIVTALLLSPLSYSGAESELHPHVETAVLLGLLIGTPVWVAVRKFPGHRATRYVVACCQMLMGCLLIHVTGGRIETHFHVFVSLAFLAFYLDWSILVPASIIVVVDHYVRGLYFPISVYGVASGAEWRFLEHTGWVLFEDFVLVFACVKGNSLIAELADRQALLETTNERIETEVALRTRELETSRRETLLRLARAAELRDSVTGQHIVRVSLLSKLLAEKLGFDEAGQDRILLASALHDVGKIGMHDDILLKEGTLTDAERRTMQSHAAIRLPAADARSSPRVRTRCRRRQRRVRTARNGRPDRPQPPRTLGWRGLPERPLGRGHPDRGAHRGRRGRVRGAPVRPPLQEEVLARRIVADHEDGPRHAVRSHGVGRVAGPRRRGRGHPLLPPRRRIVLRRGCVGSCRSCRAARRR